jgi:membrane protein YqaA with SNARE-associated domain
VEVIAVTDDLLGLFGIYGGTFFVAMLAAIVPFVTVEVFLVGVIRFAVDRASQLAWLVILAAVGQMLAKIGFYYAGRGLLELPRGRFRDRLEKARAKLESWRARPRLIYGVSSLVGLPPFYLTVLAAAAMHIQFRAFLAIGLAGRMTRFAVIAALAWVA